MKKTFKIVSLLITLVMITTVFSACGGEKEVSTGGTFTYWVPMDNTVAQTHTSFNELLMYQEMEKATGTKVEFIHPAAGSTGSEAFQILLASGDYPDMIEYWWGNSYTGGPDQAIADGVIISLNDYMEEYAPNYYYYMEGEGGKKNDYLYKATAISNGGNYYGFKNLNVGKYKGYNGLYIRKDLLDKWGLDVPVTIDDWTNVFKIAKENGIKYPLTGNKEIAGVLVSEVFNTAWGVGSGFYMDGDKVKFGPFQKEFKEYVKQMSDWMKSGYIDIDYITNNTTNVQGQITNGTSIAAFGYVGGDLGAMIPAMKERNPEFDLVACTYPVLNKGDKPIFQSLQPDASDPTVVISVQCGIDNEDRYKESIRWCDYLYSDEGIVLKSFGVEGETYTLEKDEDGNEHYIYTDKVKNYEAIGAHSIDASLYHYFLPANHPGFNQHPDYFNGYYSYQQQKDAIEIWNKYLDVAQKHVFPTVSYTGDEAAEKANIESRGKANLQAAITNIILGKASMDTYDDAIKAAKKAGYDDLLKINQAAYDRYIKVLSK